MDTPSTPRARYPASKSKFLSLRKSERLNAQSGNDISDISNKTVHFQVNILSPNLQKSNINVDVTFSPNRNDNKHIYSPLPLYKTPPSGNKNLVTFNPFNRGLHERLKRSILSPSVFSSMKNPEKTPDSEFFWSIEDVARMKPANIEEDFHYEDQMDPIAESQAQEAIEKFFSDTQLAPSPNSNEDTDAASHKEPSLIQTPCTQMCSAISSTPRRESPKHNIKKTVEVIVQTNLSLPPVLPEEVEAVLSHYFIETDNSNDDSLSTSSMRRKLFFQCEDELPSPVKPAQPPESSPILSGFTSSPSFKHYFPSTPVISSRISGTPALSQLSSPEFSPISNNHSGATTSMNSRVSMRLDFSNETKENVPMNMSVDNAPGCQSIMENTDCKMSFSEDNDNANFSLIKIKFADKSEPDHKYCKTKVKTDGMEYINSTSVMMSYDVADSYNFQRSNSKNFCWQSSSATAYHSEDTGYQSKSCLTSNLNNEPSDWSLSAVDSQNFCESASMELSVKRNFSEIPNFGLKSADFKKVAAPPLENIFNNF